MSKLAFDIAWIVGESTRPEFAKTMAELKISACGQVLTNVFDKFAGSNTDRIRMPLYPLAMWLAVNWWRIHHESSGERGERAPPKRIEPCG